MKTRIAYSDYTVKSVAYETDDLIDLAEFLEQQAPTLKDAEQFVTACGTDLRDDGSVDELGDDMFWAPRSTPKRHCEEEAIFIHMKGKWHVTDDGCSWDPLDSDYGQKVIGRQAA